MYYHPMTWPAFPDRNGRGPWAEAFGVLADGIVGQQRLRMEATKEIFLAPLQHASELADAQDAAAFAARCLAAPFRSYAKLVELSQRAGDLAARTGRELHELLRHHATGEPAGRRSVRTARIAKPEPRTTPARPETGVETKTAPGDGPGGNRARNHFA